MAFGAGMKDGQGKTLAPGAQWGKAGTLRAALIRGAGGLALVLAVACTPIYANHGYVPDESDLADVKPGVDTRDSVAAFLGRPSTEGLLGDKEWFYVQSRWKTVGAHAPQEIDRQVVAITFNDAGKVANVERFGLEKGEVVTISRRVTTETIKGKSFILQLFGNVGGVDPAQLLNRK
jgi:outer membrane protein assembly factor BamE (lipoprotein component of BamABCDE complex)